MQSGTVPLLGWLYKTPERIPAGRSSAGRGSIDGVITTGAQLTADDNARAWVCLHVGGDF